MKYWTHQATGSNRLLRSDLRMRSAFTLVEILLVIAIIGVLAGLGFQGANIAARKRDRARVEAQLERLKLVIEDYKLRFGTYPPGSNLYNELRGDGVLNKPGSSNPARQAKNFLPNLKPDETVTNGSTYLAVPALPMPNASQNVWNYRDPNTATNKHAGYDLWAEYAERGTGNSIIISNGK